MSYESLAYGFVAPVMGGELEVYGVLLSPGYRTNNATDVATEHDYEGMYSVLDGKYYNSECCFDHGNAETNNLDEGNDYMGTIGFGTRGWQWC